MVQNELRLAKQSEEERLSLQPAISLERQATSPNPKQLEKEQKFQLEIEELHEKYLLEKSEKERAIKETEELGIKWQSKYKQVTSEFLEKEEQYRTELQEKIKEIENLQHKLY